MKKFIAPEGNYYLVDNISVSSEVCTPDNFDESRLKVITKEEGDAILEAQMPKEEGV